MNSEGKFWISIWGIIAVIATILIFCLTFYNCNYNSKILIALEAGIPPKQIKLAFDDYASEAEKIIYSLKETE